MKKRIFSIFCVLCLVFTMLPATAWAADPVTYLTWSEEQGELVEATCDSYTSCSSTMSSALGTAGQTKWYVFKGSYTQRFRIEVKGDVRLILSNNCTLTAQKGIHVPDGSSLTIYAQSENESEMGKLVAEPGDDYLTYRYCAVIGGNGDDTAGSITINGGNITATGKSASNAHGAAIGTGSDPQQTERDSTMAITINGGTVKATSNSSGAAIGTGYRTDGGTITINGGTINATSNGGGAAIGTGYTGNGGTVTINGGTVKATSNRSGAAIGVGDSGTLGTVNITGGQITAAALNQRKASESGAAIGCGYFYKTGGEINISGGTINITDGYLNGIGYGHYKSSTSGSSSITITITGGSICNPYQIGGTPVNSSNAPVYKTKVDLSGVAGIAANQAVSGSITDYSYGFDDVYIDANTCLYLYLPAGETTATFGSQTFEGTVSAGDGNVLTASNAAKDPVSYIDKTGQQYSTSYYTEVTDATSTWTTGWYVVNGNTTISDRIEVTGNVSLILTDGATLTASAGIHVPETASLDICGQSGGTGKLKANAGEGNAAIGGDGGEKETTGTISICSGTVEATGGSSGGAGIGGGANCYNGTNTRGTVAIYGGTITATGGNGGAGIGTGVDGQINNIILAGGTIEANGGGDSAQDIGMGGGTSTLNSVMEFDAGGEGFGDDGGEPVLQSVSSGETNYRYDLDIRGGSIYTSGGTEAVTAPAPYNSNYGGLAVKNKIVYYAEADFGTGYANQPVSGTITVGDSDYQYSFNGVKTDAKGKLHLYTFGEEVVLTADNGSTFKGTIDATNSTLTPQQQPLSGSISISGTVQCGETLTVNTESVTPEDAKNSLTYIWYRCTSSDGTEATQISDAAGSTYTLTGDDAGKYIKVVVASTDYSGSLSAVTTSTVQKIPATVSAEPTAKEDLVYTGSAQALVTAGSAEGGTMMYRLGDSGDFSDTVPTATNAGDYSVWYYVKGDENHSDTQPVEVKVTIAKATPTYTVPADLAATYGDTLADVALPDDWAWDDAVTTSVGNVGDNTFAATFTPSDTDNYNTVTKNLTVAVFAKDITGAAITLGDALTYTGQEQTQQIASVIVDDLTVTTYEISGNTGTDADTYTLTVTGTGNFTGTATKEWTIAKANYNGATDVSGTVLANWSDKVTLPAIPAGASYGTPSTTDDLTGLSIEGGVLSYTGGESIAEGQEYEITVPVNGGQNYVDYEITVTLTGTDKQVLTITGVTAQGGTYNGQAQTGYTGTPSAQGFTGEFVVTYNTADGKAPTDAGTYTATIAIPEDDAQYVGSIVLEFAIAKKPLTVSAPSASVYVGDSAPKLALAYTGLVDGESVTPSEDPVFTITKADGTVIALEDAVKTAGTYTITWSNADQGFTGDENYDIQTETAGTLTVSNRSSGGTTTYPVQVEENSQNGGVQVSPKNAVPGTLVTVTPQPAPGYELATLTVLDQYGNEVDVNPLGNGNYSFKMPRSRVKVEATFYCTGSELCPTHHLADVLVKAWYHDAVDYVVEHGIMTGTSATTFEPNTTLSRAMVAQILYNLEGQPTVTGESTFTDVSGHWAIDAITWAQKTGVVDGYEDNTFRPENNVTRQEFAQMMYNYAAYKDYDLSAKGDLSQFTDGDSVQEWAVTAMSWANGNALINGHDDGTLEPGGTTTRAQAASILMRFDQNLVEN